ncbi:MAG: endonuclease/exonuclease/phosphatase family protein [Gammaproteobacteria bacterium]|nr:endonuclease/exonuclease/phosphatase family protein [Gammaproteobacteria bacterium]
MILITYNIQYGRGKDERFDLERIAGEVAGADIIALQEVERFWTRSGNVDQPRELAKLLGDYYWVFGPGVDLHSDSPPGVAADSNRRRQFGNMLLSRSPILSTRNHLLPKYASLGPMSLQRNALECVVGTASGPVRFYSVHLTHLSEETRLPQVERLLDIHARARIEGAAITGGGLKDEWTSDGLPQAMPPHAVMMGDFNFEPDSTEYIRIAGPLSPYGGRVTNPEGFVDAWVESGHEVNEGVTADIRGRPVRLDYCFLSAALRDRVRDVAIDSEATGSDHQPVRIDIGL